jgi:hypothetical protein
MKQFVLGLSVGLVGLATAALAQTDPNAPTGPNNPNPPAQLTGQATPVPCGPPTNLASNSAGTTSPMAAAGQAQSAPGNRPASDAKDKLSAATGCAGQDHPAGGSMSAPAMAPHQ